MRILLVGDYLPDKNQSMHRYSSMLERELSSRGHRVVCLRPCTVLRGLYNSKWLGYVDKYLLLAPFLRKEAKQADVVHICDHGNAMLTRLLGETPHVVTCHDMLEVRSARGEFAEHKVSGAGRLLQGMIADGLNHARAIVCVSKKTRNDVLRILKCSPDDVTCIYNALNAVYEPMDGSDAQQHLIKLGVPLTEPYFLHVGGNQWYKNRLGLLRIFSFLQADARGRHFRLVLAGDSRTSDIQSFIDGHDLQGKVLSVSPSDDELRALYSQATALLFPSIEEGFGWPILEAQACSCPVVTTARDPMTEVAGDAAIFIDPSNPAGAARTILDSLPELEGLSLRGWLNSQRFSISAMIDSYVELYRHIANHPENTETAGHQKLQHSSRLIETT
jgi:glycosyltransferase involved in cell wall biosynthesis